MPINHELGKAHRPELNEQDRRKQLKDVDLETREEYIQDGLSENSTPINAMSIKKQRIKRICMIFVAMFILSLVVGMVVSEFMGPGGVLAGLGIGAVVGVVLFILPMILILAFKK